MSNINLYSTTVTAPKKVAMPKELSQKPNKHLLAQAIHVYRARLHRGGGKTKTRGEISLTKAKIYKQKGTGNARHGAKSAPIFVGGSKAHGPTGVKRVLNLPKKMRKQALSSALSARAAKNAVIYVDGIGKVKKTKTAAELVQKIRKGEEMKKGRIILVLGEKSAKLEKYFKNIDDLKVVRFKDLNAYQVMFGGKIALERGVFKTAK